MTQGMCDTGMTFADYIRDFAFVKAGVCPYANDVGFLVLGLVVWAVVAIVMTVRTGSLAMTAITTILIGGAVLSQVAAPGIPFVTVLVLAIVGSVIAGLYMNYS